MTASYNGLPRSLHPAAVYRPPLVKQRDHVADRPAQRRQDHTAVAPSVRTVWSVRRAACRDPLRDDIRGAIAPNRVLTGPKRPHRSRYRLPGICWLVTESWSSRRCLPVSRHVAAVPRTPPSVGNPFLEIHVSTTTLVFSCRTLKVSTFTAFLAAHRLTGVYDSYEATRSRPAPV